VRCFEASWSCWPTTIPKVKSESFGVEFMNQPRNRFLKWYQLGLLFIKWFIQQVYFCQNVHFRDRVYAARVGLLWRNSMNNFEIWSTVCGYTWATVLRSWCTEMGGIDGVDMSLISRHISKKMRRSTGAVFAWIVLHLCTLLCSSPNGAVSSNQNLKTLVPVSRWKNFVFFTALHSKIATGSFWFASKKMLYSL